MTIEIVPAADSPWRAYPAPKDVDLANGPWCPMDIKVGLLPEQHGWVCASCGAHWDLHGRHGRWLTASSALLIDGHFIEHDEPTGEPVGRPGRVGRAVAGAVVAGAVLGGGYAAGRACRPYADLVPEALLWSLSLIVIGLLLTGAGALLAWRWWTSHNTGGGAA